MIQRVARYGVDPATILVSVYKNLSARHGSECWSIKSAQPVAGVPAGRVIAHADRLILVDAVMVTRPGAIRAMVAGDGPRGHKRNVFAWITGKLADGQVVTGERRVTFHPFERPDFYAVDTGETVIRADAVVFDRFGRCWI